MSSFKNPPLVQSRWKTDFTPYKLLKSARAAAQPACVCVCVCVCMHVYYIYVCESVMCECSQQTRGQAWQPPAERCIDLLLVNKQLDSTGGSICLARLPASQHAFLLGRHGSPRSYDPAVAWKLHESNILYSDWNEVNSLHKFTLLKQGSTKSINTVFGCHNFAIAGIKYHVWWWCQP